MCEKRNAFYIQASCLCLEANSLRDSEQSAANITIYQVSLSQHCECGKILETLQNRDVVATNHDYEMISSSSFITAKAAHTRMWANAQRDGRPAEHRWRPLFNAAKFG